MMSLFESKVEEVKELIIKEALEMFYYNGINDTKLSDIAKKCRVGESTVYRYFGTKANLVSKTAVLLWEQMKLKVDKVATESLYDEKNGIEQIAYCLNVYLNIYKKNQQYYRYLYEFNKYMSSQEISTEEHKALLKKRLFVVDYLLAAIEKGKKDGTIRIDANPQYAIRAILASSTGIAEKVALFEKGVGATENTIDELLACNEVVLYYLRRSKSEEE